MTFHSPQFFVLFPCVLFLYFLAPLRYRNAILLAASAWFYMAWRPEYILLIFFSVTIDYFVALGMTRSTARWRRPLLSISLASNLGLLFFYKYFGFVADTLRGFHFPVQLPGWNVILPIGISFYTFQALSYTIDVYRGTVPAERNYFQLMLFVLFFPQLVAGPIERSPRMFPQFREAHEFDYERAASGLRLALWGLVKKVAIADRLAVLADAIYLSPREHGGLVLLAGTLAFAFQIYADFSAYSDIAIGTARVLGFRLMTNFDRPYYAASPIEFWRRWHISLSTWFRDYVYVPLGGNRAGEGRWAIAALTTFLLSGLWHGAAWTFLIWGAYHGVLVLLTRTAGRLTPRRPPRWLAILVTFLLVLIGWVLFRAKSAPDAGYVLRQIASAGGSIQVLLDHQLDWFLAALGIGAVLLSDLRGPMWEQRWPLPLRWAAYVAGVLLVVNGLGTGDTPFIYFQF